MSHSNDLSSLERLRHSTAHVMADAVKKLFPEAKIAIGPPIETGFYYDFDVPIPFSEDDLEKIEAEMAKIIEKNLPFQMEEISREAAKELFASANEDYKVELLEAIPENETVTLCRHGDFVDLCRGGHVESTGEIKAFKLTSVAGAYWRGDERNKMLQRIYGTAFPDAKSLRKHLTMLEEAKKRDHRRLGKDLDLFSFSETIGAGLTLWHPKGGLIRHLIETYWREEHLKNGYELVYTPHIAREELWKKSGHLGFYAENMYSGMDIDGQNYLAKPMNCPYHIVIYKNKLRSYRDFPMRWAELGTVYRYERAGVLHGLFRVRGFTQDDAHLFVRPDQLAVEVDSVLAFCVHILSAFGFSDFELYLSTRPEKYVGTLDQWNEAEVILTDALKRSGIKFQIDPGGGVFYGPKIDLKIRDSLGRRWQCSTIQVDFQLPERFDMTFVGEDGKRDHRPIMIHRALLGSLERFFGILVEHYGGDFPLWLAPLQVIVLTVTDNQIPFANQVLDILQKHGIRAKVDLCNEKLGAKIRNAQLDKVPYSLVIGDKEVATQTVAPRPRKGAPLNAMPVEEFIEKMLKEQVIQVRQEKTCPK